MAGLAEWHFEKSGGVQLFKDDLKAGKGTMTLLVSSVQDERERLEAAGLPVGSVERGGAGEIMRLSDPDGNLVVLAGPLAD